MDIEVVRMDIEFVRAICQGSAGATVDGKWASDLYFRVGGKMYAILSIDPGRTRLRAKIIEEMSEVLTSMPEIILSPYLARYKWVCLEHLDALDAGALKTHSERPPSLIFAKLPGKARKSIHSDHRPGVVFL